MAFEFNSLLDADMLASLYDDDLSSAKEVFTAFLSDTKAEFEFLKEAWQKNDIKMIRQKLHKIKPTFSFVGLTSLTEESEKVISLCDRSSTINDIEPSFSDLMKRIEESFIIVEKELERMTNII